MLPISFFATTEKGFGGKRFRAGFDNSKHIVKSLVIGEEHKPVLLRDVFHTMDIDLHISAPVGMDRDIFQKGVLLFFRIFIRMRGVITQPAPGSRNKKEIPEYHK